jgi:hypothetical protein
VTACAVIGSVAVGGTLLYVFSRDTWERDNVDRLLATLEKAEALEKSDPMAAFKAYDEVLKEIREHKIEMERLSIEVARAEKTRDALYASIEDQLQEEEAEKQRRLEEEEAERERRVAEEAAEKKRLAAEEADRLRAEEEARKAARAEEKRRKEAVAMYSNPPQSARTALNALKKIGARLDVGINYREYSTLVGDSWAEVKIFIDSSDGRKLAEFSRLLVKASDDYKLAHDIWHNTIEYPRLYGDRADVERHRQKCWRQAQKFIDFADSLLDVEKTVKSQEALPTFLANEDDAEAEWRTIDDAILKK